MKEKINYTGDIYIANGLKIAYVKQSINDLSGTLKDYAIKNNLNENLLFTVLIKMGFERNQFALDINMYSDGQKKKVLLAHAFTSEAHLLVLDEPLNYIDVLSRVQIEELILSYQPTMIFVEHDKCFIDTVATHKIYLK